MGRISCIWVLNVLHVCLMGCNTANTALDATSLYARGMDQDALGVIDQAKSDEKNVQWSNLQEATVSLDLGQFERAAAAIAAAESRDEAIDERAVVSGTQIGDELGASFIDERMREWTCSLGERVMYEYIGLVSDLLRGNAEQGRVSSIRISRAQTLLEERRRMPPPVSSPSKERGSQAVVKSLRNEAAYQRAIKVYEKAAEDPRCAVASLLAGWTRLHLGDSAGRDLLQEAVALDPEHDVAARLLAMPSEQRDQMVLVVQEDGLCPTLRPLRFDLHTLRTGVARVAFPIPVTRVDRRCGAVSGSDGAPLQTLSDVDALYLAEEFRRAPARLVRTATRLLSQEAAARHLIRETDDRDSLSQGVTRLGVSILRTVLVDADTRSWDTRPSVIRVGLLNKTPDGIIQLDLPEGRQEFKLPPGPNFVRIRTRSGIPTVVQTSPPGLFGASTVPMTLNQQGNPHESS